MFVLQCDVLAPRRQCRRPSLGGAAVPVGGEPADDVRVVVVRRLAATQFHRQHVSVPPPQCHDAPTPPRRAPRPPARPHQGQDAADLRRQVAVATRGGQRHHGDSVDDDDDAQGRADVQLPVGHRHGRHVTVADVRRRGRWVNG